MLGISKLLDEKPKALSGGQQQRVALGRAIVREPSVFLMDEPLSNLDAKLRSDMRTELQELQADLDVTTVYVTHDQTEAMAMGDRIAVMDGGVLQQVGAPGRGVPFAGEPVRRGLHRFAEHQPPLGRRRGRDPQGPGGFTYELDDPEPIAGHDRVRVGVRPEDITVVDSGQNTADVTVVEPMGNENFLYMEMDGHELTARVDPSIRPAAEETQVSFDFREAALYLFDAQTGDALKTKTDNVDPAVVGATED